MSYSRKTGHLCFRFRGGFRLYVHDAETLHALLSLGFLFGVKRPLHALLAGDAGLLLVIGSSAKKGDARNIGDLLFRQEGGK